jgi:hypothetical protein
VVEAALSAARRRRGLLAVWIVLGVLVAVIAALEIGDRRHAAPAAADARLLLPIPVGELGAVEVADRGRLHRFERDPSGGWFYHGVHAATEGAHTHAPDAALSARIEAALAAFGRTRIERRLGGSTDVAAYGLAAPDVVVLVYRRGQSQPFAQYAFGALAPDTVSRYTQQVGQPGVVTIANYQVENLQSLIRTASESAATGPVGRR